MPRKPLHIVYIPGLGDSRVGGQQKAVRTWRRYKVHGHLFQMNWADGEAWQHKFDRLLAFIDELLKAGNDVAIVGVSAGGSAVVNAYAARKDQLVGAVLIAGKVNRPMAVSSSLQNNNPAFVTSINDAQLALEQLEDQHRVRILSRFGYDPIVPKKDSVIPGATNKRVPSSGHFLTIATQITLGAPSFIRFLKKLQT